MKNCCLKHIQFQFILDYICSFITLYSLLNYFIFYKIVYLICQDHPEFYFCLATVLWCPQFYVVYKFNMLSLYFILNVMNEYIDWDTPLQNCSFHPSVWFTHHVLQKTVGNYYDCGFRLRPYFDWQVLKSYKTQAIWYALPQPT